MILRLAGGDLNALFGLAGFVVGILAGVYFLNRGYSLKRTYSLSRVEGAVLPIIQIVLLVVLVAALIFAGLMAGRLSRRIVDPLNRLDLEHPLENDAYEELAPLLSRINYQHSAPDCAWWAASGIWCCSARASC